jgi:hypothetical protein
MPALLLYLLSTVITCGILLLPIIMGMIFLRAGLRHQQAGPAGQGRKGKEMMEGARGQGLKGA